MPDEKDKKPISPEEALADGKRFAEERGASDADATEFARRLAEQLKAAQQQANKGNQTNSCQG